MRGIAMHSDNLLSCGVRLTFYPNTNVVTCDVP